MLFLYFKAIIFSKKQSCRNHVQLAHDAFCIELFDVRMKQTQTPLSVRRKSLPP
jgi:hypothetical protein